jgi:hypothetical protein
MKNNFIKMPNQNKMMIIVIFISLFIIKCVPESHWKKKYRIELSDLCIFQEVCFSSLLFGLQGMQKTINPHGKTTYQEWPFGFDSLIPVSNHVWEYYQLNNKDTSTTRPSSPGVNQIDIFLDRNWPNPGSTSYLNYYQQYGSGSNYLMTLTMKDTTSDGKWILLLYVIGGGRPYEYSQYGSWEAHYEVTWHPNNPLIFEDDELSFVGLGKSKNFNAPEHDKHALSFITSSKMHLRSGVPGIYGDKLDLFPFNLPMASFSLAKIESEFPESYSHLGYSTTLIRGQARGHFWDEYYNSTIYSSLLYQFGILKIP